MAMDVAKNVYTCAGIQPAQKPELAVVDNVNFAVNSVIPKGTILGQVTAAANDVQTLTVTGVPTGGSLTLQAANPGGALVPVVVAWNSTGAQATTAAQTALGPNVTVTGGPLPGTALIFTFGGDLGNRPVPVMTVLTNGLTGGTTPAGAIAHTTTGATANTYKAYATGNSDGSQVARGICQYDIATDANGLVSLGGAVGAGRDSFNQPCAPVFFKGNFFTQDLIGLDAGAVTALGRIEVGTLANGILALT